MNKISQSVLPSSPIQNIPVRQSTRRQAGNTARLIEACNQNYIGVATKQSTDGQVELVAFATPGEVFVISVEPGNHQGLIDQSFRLLLLGKAGLLVGFDMAKLALRLHRDLKLPVCGFDLSTLFANTRDPWPPSKFIGRKVSPSINKFDVDNLWNSASEEGSRNVCLRAWLSACAAAAPVTSELKSAQKVDTRSVSDMELTCLGNFCRQIDLLDARKPSAFTNEFSQAKMLGDGNVSLQNARYRNRVRRSHQTAVVLTNENGREFIGRARSSVGKTTTIKFAHQSFSGIVQNVRVIGRQELTYSEKARDEFLLHVLQGKKTLRNSTFIRKLWFPPHRKHRSGNRTENFAPPKLNLPNLNPSQVEAVSAMISKEPLIIVHGPPGTGKTMTISQATAIWFRNGVPTWVVAHSNVAVKNIAEKLYKLNVEFRILVSKEFYFEWHEHVYEKIQEKLIRSDELPDNPGALQRTLHGTCIMLSTLSMLSNPALDDVFEFIPVTQLVIDEASQINLFDFMHLFEKYKDLKKVCFFGDPHQLPPYGKENAPGLQTIFDLEHLCEKAKFLDVQYRKLKSQHKLRDMSCLSFVNVSNGEEEKAGFSWKNVGEIGMVVHLVRSYYKQTDFCVITPYDAQRAAIEAQLKRENLPWEHVFNVDSFQGNEAEYVLISVVRSSKPGFLTSLQRMNVMLTRCRAGLVIVTSKSFLQGGGEHTLLGKLARFWEISRSNAWVDWRFVAEGKVDLPGSPGPRRDSGLRTPFEQVPQNVNGTVTVRQPLLPLTSFNGTNVAFEDVSKLSWAQIAGLPHVPQRFPKTGSPRVPYSGTSMMSGTTVPHIPKQPFRVSNYPGHEWQRANYYSDFPSLGIPQSRWNPPCVPQPPVRRQKIGQKASVPGKTPRLPQITSKTVTNIPLPSPLSPTVEIISPRVIRILPSKPCVDDATNVQQVVGDTWKRHMDRKSSSK